MLHIISLVEVSISGQGDPCITHTCQLLRVLWGGGDHPPLRIAVGGHRMQQLFLHTFILFITISNKRPKGPHIVHLSTMCHICCHILVF